MFIKKKHIAVIVFSSSIILLVLLSTLAGYILYTQWTKDSFVLKYKNSIYKLTAEIFRKEILITNVTVETGQDEFYSGLPLLTGSLRNNTAKTITFILMEVSFVRPDGMVLYKDRFCPLGEQYFGSTTLAPIIQNTKNILLPGEGVSFRHRLANCPKELIEQLLNKNKFAKNDSADNVKIVYAITGLSLL
ncbi:MAG: hypothetical protein ABH883_03690 [Candidatus Omnitrophota bacterium]